MDLPSDWRGKRDVIGSVDAQGFTAQKRISYRNSFQYRLNATLADAPGGTRVSGRFAMNPLILVFVAVFVSVVGMVAIAVLPGELGPMLAGNAPPDGWVALVPLWMLFGLAAMLLIGRAIGTSEGEFLADFVRRTVEAR